LVSVDALPPVKRVEFRVGNHRILARNAPPYAAELDLGDAPERIPLHAIGYDARGRYVDADALILNDTENPAPCDDYTHHRQWSRSLQAHSAQIQRHAIEERRPSCRRREASRMGAAAVIRAIVTDESGYEASAELRSVEVSLRRNRHDVECLT
jgi:hypothetical protein